jgi:glutaredoxin 3
MTIKNKATVWSQPRCAYCEQAKALLLSKGYEIDERMLTTQADKIAFFERFPILRTVPQIVIDGKHVGGFTELKEYLRA